LSFDEKESCQLRAIAVVGMALPKLSLFLVRGGASRPHAAFTNRRNSFIRTESVAGQSPHQGDHYTQAGNLFPLDAEGCPATADEPLDVSQIAGVEQKRVPGD
jgi:hypothetical protein